jgi:hypothetical protein
LAVDVLHGQPSRALRIEAGINEAGDARMSQSRQNPSLRAQSLLECRCVESHPLDRDLLGNIAITALAQPDFTHATASEQTRQAEWSQGLGVAAWRFGRLLVGFQLAQHTRQLEQCLNLRVGAECLGQ